MKIRELIHALTEDYIDLDSEMVVYVGAEVGIVDKVTSRVDPDGKLRVTIDVRQERPPVSGGR